MPKDKEDKREPSEEYKNFEEFARKILKAPNEKVNKESEQWKKESHQEKSEKTKQSESS